MPGFFSRLKGRDGPAKVKKGAQQTIDEAPQKPRWVDAWTRTSVEPEEVQELLKGCTVELKARGLEMPFLLLPFRPTSDPSAARTFVRNYFDRGIHGEFLLQELRLTEPMVLCSVVKWCWSRLPSGVVGWDAYELFKVGESDSNMARNAFATFIPLSVSSDARAKIIFDFFDLLSAIAAYSKNNGLGGRKLSRLAGWWAFEQSDDGNGFEGGYKKWITAADATSHLFFAYLRSLSPGSVKGLNGICTLPMSLQKLVQDTEYPPERLPRLQKRTFKVVMIVDSVSPTPFALLRRANHFQYRDDDRALKEFAEYDDPVRALTDECRRVLKSISSTNQSQISSSKDSTGLTDASWSRFEDIGFSGVSHDEDDDDDEMNFTKRRTQGLKSTPNSKNMAMGRPTTPSWADFLSSGFVEDASSAPSPLLLPPDLSLPPIDTMARGRSSESYKQVIDGQHLEPGELASITQFDLDDSFWWVWISSLAGEEYPARKAVFGRCALIETTISGGRWFVMEEMVKGAAPAPEEGAYIAEKKSFWGRSKKSKGIGGIGRRKSTGKHALDKPNNRNPGPLQNPNSALSKTSIGPDQHARIQAAAAQLQQIQKEQELELLNSRRGRAEDAVSMKTSSVFTLQPVIMSEASPAMKWASKYDKDAIREAYLANSNHGRGPGEVSSTTLTTSSQHNSSQRTPRPATPEAGGSPAVPLKQVPTATAPIPPTQSVVPAQQEPRNLSEPVPTYDHERQTGNSISVVRPSVDQTSRSPVNKLQKRDPTSNGFKKLFGRNKARPPQASNGREAVEKVGGGGIVRKLSGFRSRSITPTNVPSITSPSPAPPSRHETDLPTPIASPHPAHDRSYDPSVRESLSRVATNDSYEARQEFSRFDQGPMEDVPAFVPMDSPRPSSDMETKQYSPPIQLHRLEDEEEQKQPVSFSADRWAQIRLNAAKRTSTAAQRPSDDLKTDDGETSGEETIESRVARIKARVAELTGNIDGSGLSTLATSTPPRAVRRV